MLSVLALLCLIKVSHGLVIVCNATLNATCYGTTGQPVNLQLMKRANAHDLKLSIMNKNVVRFKGFKTVFYNEFNTSSFHQRWQFAPGNGTLMINPAESRDSETYRVVIYEINSGKNVGQQHVQLVIKDSVSPAGVSLGVILLCVCVAIGVCYVWKRRRNPPTPVDGEVNDVIYTTVTEINSTRKETRSGPDPESVYVDVVIKM